MSNSAKNYTVRGNTVFNVGGNGIHNNGDVGQGPPGINTNAVIENNIIHDVCFGIGGQAISADGLQNSLIRNNLIYNSYSKGISLYLSNASQGSRNNIVVNNTVVTGTTPGQSFAGAALRIADDSSGNIVLNNILSSVSSTFASIDTESADLTGFVSDYNVISNVLIDDSNVGGLSGWQTKYGQDVHSFSATPAQLFVNLSGHDYHLKAGSPAIDAGTSSQAPLRITRAFRVRWVADTTSGPMKRSVAPTRHRRRRLPRRGHRHLLRPPRRLLLRVLLRRRASLRRGRRQQRQQQRRAFR